MMSDSRTMQSDVMGESTSMSVCLAVADAEGIDPLELKEPLYDTIDPGALDSLGENGGVEIYFEYLGYDITITKAGDVIVDDS